MGLSAIGCHPFAGSRPRFERRGARAVMSEDPDALADTGNKPSRAAFFATRLAGRKIGRGVAAIAR